MRMIHNFFFDDDNEIWFSWQTQFLQTAISILLSYFWQIISFQSSDDWRISTWICIFQWFSFLSKRQRRLHNWFAFKKRTIDPVRFYFKPNFRDMKNSAVNWCSSSFHRIICSSSCLPLSFILSSFLTCLIIIDYVFFLKIQITTPLSFHQLLKLDLSTCKKCTEKGNR